MTLAEQLRTALAAYRDADDRDDSARREQARGELVRINRGPCGAQGDESMTIDELLSNMRRSCRDWKYTIDGVEVMGTDYSGPFVPAGTFYVVSLDGLGFENWIGQTSDGKRGQAWAETVGTAPPAECLRRAILIAKLLNGASQ